MYTTVNKYLPAMAVRCTDINSNPNQEVHDIVMPKADGIMKGSDAFFIWLAGITHLGKAFYTQ